MMYGGEFSDGQGNEVYSDLFRWNLDRNEWKKIESLNTPSPRCSHQTVFYKVSLSHLTPNVQYLTHLLCNRKNCICLAVNMQRGISFIIIEIFGRWI